MRSDKLSLIIPVRNERENIIPLLFRIDQTLSKANIEYEIIAVDDYSTDGSLELLRQLSQLYPIKVVQKKGKIGKGFSLLEGFSHTRYDTIGYIDADLAYPPEALPEMLNKLSDHDIVVADRVYVNGERKVKKFFAKLFRLLFGRMLFGLNYDVQAGLKVFKKETIQNLELHPGVWSFDIEFLLQALHAGARIVSHKVDYGSRQRGKGKLNLMSAGLELVLLSLKSRLSILEPIVISNGDGMRNTAIGWRKQRFVTHSTLDPREAALRTVSIAQILFLLVFILLVALLVSLNWHFSLILFVGGLSVLYFLDLMFNLYLVYVSFKDSPQINVPTWELKRNRTWPTYTIICPLYKEWKVVPQFLEGIRSLDYPKDKLQVMLVLEEDDVETLERIRQQRLPSYVKVLVVPDSLPKTKPKACNYALSYATCEYAVIYDAEDIPEPLQLKKAVVAFEKLKDDNVVCLQAKLNFYNPKQNLLTRLFTVEYSLWFELILTGLYGIEAPIPLGGTSNHFKTSNLRLLQGWDPFNVTEDCDLGMRLFKYGYRTAILDSETLEEANSNFTNWLRQRSRWIKGYIQTYLVHMRRPHEFITDWKNPHLLTFQLVVGGKVLSMLINPLLWATTIVYFVARSSAGGFIESLYPTSIYYIAVFSLVFGNFFYLYNYMIGCAKREQWSLVKYAYFTPIYWLMMSVSSWIAIYQVIVKPHYWEKTKHGLHINEKEPQTVCVEGLRPAYPSL